VMSLSNIDKPNAAAKFKFHISFGAALAKIWNSKRSAGAKYSASVAELMNLLIMV
jgi:hypothetical protein